jgi:hypothetical protein
MCINEAILRDTCRQQGEAINVLIARLVDAEGLTREGSGRQEWLNRYCAILAEVEQQTAHRAA